MGKHWLALMCLLSLPTSTISAQDECYCFDDQSEKSAPRLEDCVSLLNNFAQSGDRRSRVFDEEQMRAEEDGSWPGLEDVGAAQLPFSIQVPRVFSRSLSTFELAIARVCQANIVQDLVIS